MKISNLLGIFLFLNISCNSQENVQINTEDTLMNTEHKYTNSLVHETSPYLLQHAHNPVDWHPWNEETLAKAKKEDKLLLISEILFDKDVKQKDLSSTLDSSDFDEDELIKYARVLASFQFNTEGKLIDISTFF